MDHLVQWLGEQLDEDARIARVAAEEAWGAEWRYDGQYVQAAPELDMVAVGSQDYMDPKVGTHIACHDPARVLREIDAKREILRTHFQAQPKWCVICDVPGDYEGRPHGCTTVRLLALPYADRPGYRDEWRP